MKIDEKRIIRNRIRNYILIILAILCVAFGCFTVFYLNTEAKKALREAKNVKLAFQMLDIEYYGKGKNILDEKKRSGIRDDAMERIRSVIENEAEIQLTGYDKGNRVVTGFIYETKRVRVVYYKEDMKNTWKVEYLLPVLSYEEVSE